MFALSNDKDQRKHLLSRSLLFRYVQRESNKGFIYIGAKAMSLPGGFIENQRCGWRKSSSVHLHLKSKTSTPWCHLIRETRCQDAGCFITARQRSCGKVIFSQVSVCPQGWGVGTHPLPRDTWGMGYYGIWSTSGRYAS